MIKDSEFRTQIQSMKRLRNSPNGNPRFMVTFVDGPPAQTRPDASVNYEIQNPEFRDVPVVVTLSAAGRITGIRVAD